MQILHIREGDYVVWINFDHTEGSGILQSWSYLGAGQGSSAEIRCDDRSIAFVDPIYFTHIIAGGIR